MPTEPIREVGDCSTFVQVTVWPPERQDHATVYVKPRPTRGPNLAVASEFGGTGRFSADRITLEAVRDALCAALGPPPSD